MGSYHDTTRSPRPKKGPNGRLVMYLLNAMTATPVTAAKIARAEENRIKAAADKRAAWEAKKAAERRLRLRNDGLGPGVTFGGEPIAASRAAEIRASCA